MGIPNLTRHLLSHAESVRLGDLQCHPVDRQDMKTVRRVIIDGPSLIYDVYARLLSWKNASSSTIHVLPTYEQVSLGVILFLKQLNLANVSVVKIFFDGALPNTKRGERLARLENSRKKLEAFCHFTRQGFEPHDYHEPLPLTDPVQALRVSSISRTARNLPDLSFIVPAVMEDLTIRWDSVSVHNRLSLSSSDGLDTDFRETLWGSVCDLVPGEADAFCAELARKSHAAILTNDSDLLVYDLGSQGSVVFLNSIEIEPCCDNGRHKMSGIRGLQVTPATVTNRIGIPNLQSFAFAMSRLTKNSNLTEIVTYAKQLHTIEEDEDAYRLFLKRYASHSDDISLHWPTLHGLDVRLSEVVVQFSVSSELDGRLPHFYLPNLVEDHNRKCSWQEGRNIRVLAFSLLGQSDRVSIKYGGYIECVRRGCRFCFDEIPFLGKDRIIHNMCEVLGTLKTLQRGFEPNSVRKPSFWRICAFFWISNETHESSRMDDCRCYRELYLKFLGIHVKKGRVDWMFIHRVAQLQSVLYSLRMLKQILMIVGHKQWMTQDEWDLLNMLPPLRILMRSYFEIRKECLDEDSLAIVAA